MGSAGQTPGAQNRCRPDVANTQDTSDSNITSAPNKALWLSHLRVKGCPSTDHQGMQHSDIKSPEPFHRSTGHPFLKPSQSWSCHSSPRMLSFVPWCLFFNMAPYLVVYSNPDKRPPTRIHIEPNNSAGIYSTAVLIPQRPDFRQHIEFIVGFQTMWKTRFFTVRTHPVWHSTAHLTS